MFIVLPTSADFIKEDAEWFIDLAQAYDAAYDWSAELHGQRVNIYEFYAGKYNKLTEVFA